MNLIFLSSNLISGGFRISCRQLYFIPITYSKITCSTFGTFYTHWLVRNSGRFRCKEGRVYDLRVLRGWCLFAWAFFAQNAKKMSKIRLPTNWADQTYRFIRLELKPRNSHPVKSIIWPVFWPQLFSALSRAHKFGIKMLQIQKRIVIEWIQRCRTMPTYPNAHANAKKWFSIFST